MRKLLLISLVLVSAPAFAVIEFLEGGDKGPTYIDSVENMGYINFTQTIAGPITAVPKVPKDTAGNIINNYYVIRTKKADGSVETVNKIATDVDCAALLASGEAIFCKGFTALEINLTETPGGAALPAPQAAYIAVDLKSADRRALITSTNPGEELVIIRDAANPAGIISSMKNKTFCDLPRKRVSLDGPWNKADFPLSHIYTSDTPSQGFYISDHTQYIYDEKSGNWCYRFFPNLTQTEPVCRKDFNDITLKVDFLYNSSGNKVNKGVVHLTKDENGQPVAYVGSAKETTLSASTGGATTPAQPELDETKPVMKISMKKNDKQVPVTVFQGFSKVGGTAGRALTVSPNYSMGNDFNGTTSCDSSTCLSPVANLMASTDRTTKKICSANSDPLDLDKATLNQECYSCSGVTPGACGTDKKIIDKTNYAGLLQTVGQCQESSAPPVPVDPGATLPPVNTER